MEQKEFLVTFKVVTTYHVQCFAEHIEDLRNMEDNGYLLPEQTQDRLEALRYATGLIKTSWCEMIDRYSQVEEIVSVDEATWEI